MDENPNDTLDRLAGLSHDYTEALGLPVNVYTRPLTRGAVEYVLEISGVICKTFDYFFQVSEYLSDLEVSVEKVRT